MRSHFTSGSFQVFLIRRRFLRILQLFAARFSSEAALYSCQDGPPLVPLTLIQIGLSISITKTGRIANSVRMVEEHILEYMQAYLAWFGLTHWAPDFRQTPYSLYNSACRIVALDTFKQAIVSGAYNYLNPKKSYIKDAELLIKLFDNFVFFYLYSRYRKEIRNTGCVKAGDEANPAYRGRSRVCYYWVLFFTRCH